MKRTTYLNMIPSFQIVLLIVLPLLISACQKDERKEEIVKCTIVAKEGSNDNVIGKWKLVTGETTFFNPRKEDYSCQDIIYDFREDGTLVISGNNEQLIGYEGGEYTFEFSKIELYEGLNYSLTIENGSIGCSIEKNHMILDNSPLDGPILHLVRIG